MYLDINDNEIIYLIREGNEAALNLMYKKYYPVIIYVIRKYRVPYDLYEEYISEGYMSLTKALENYSDIYSKSFYMYYLLILERDTLKLLKKSKHYDIPVEDIEVNLAEPQREYNARAHNIYNKGLELLVNNDEITIYKALFNEGLTPQEASIKYNMPPKRVYNIIRRIKIRLNKNINIDYLE